MGEFDIQAARNAGLSDEEIAGELAKHHNYDLSAAINAGHSYTDVANELASQPMQHPRGEYEGDPVEAAVIGGALGATGSTAKGTVKTGYDIIHRLVNGPKKVETPVVEPSPAEAAPVVEDPAVQPIDIPAEPTAAELAGKEKWNTKLTGASVPGSQMDAASLAKNRDLMKAAHEMGGSLSNEGILLGPKDTHANRVAEDALKRARQARVESALKDAHLAEEARMSAKLKAEQAARAAQAAQEASIPGRAKAVLTGAQKVAKPVTTVISKIGSIPLLGPTLATAGTLGEAQDAYDRAQHGDYGRALISGLGAIGSAASALAPTPATKGIGGAASIAAPAINALIDKYYGREGYADGGMVGTEPSQGGLNYRDYPNPYGLRAYKNKDGSYGGEMLPKSTGWLGLLAGTGPNKGSVMSEYSIGDEQGDFPSLNPLLDQSQIGRVLGGKMSPDIIQKAMEWRDMQKSKGQSPFYNPPGFNQ
jgi:hypothetical protein